MLRRAAEIMGVLKVFGIPSKSSDLDALASRVDSRASSIEQLRRENSPAGAMIQVTGQKDVGSEEK